MALHHPVGRLLVLVSLVVSGACAAPLPLWKPRVAGGCAAQLGDPRLDQERAYLATLLALSERQYAILHSELPVLIEAESKSDYHPEIFHTRWVLRVHENGLLEVDAPENARATHPRSEDWYAKLRQTFARFQCRDLNWLRWEAQNRGLLAVGAGLTDIPAGEGTSGAEALPVSEAGPQPNLPPSPEARLVLQRRMDDLRQKRRELKLWDAVAWSGVGVGLLGAGLGLGLQGVIEVTRCQNASDACISHEYARGLGFAGLAIGVTGGVFLAVALPKMFHRLSRYRALSRELRALKGPALSFGVGSADSPFTLTVSGRF